MPKKTKIDKLPQATRDLIATLRGQGATIDEIHAHLMKMDVKIARSTTAKHLAKIDKMGEQIRETRVIADALVASFGEDIDDKTLRLNIEMLKGVIMQIQAAAAGEDGEALDPQGAYFLATALQRLAKAKADDTARQLKERTEFAKAAAKQVEAVAKAQGLTGETVTAIKAAILGVEAPKPKAPLRPEDAGDPLPEDAGDPL
jgi:hypothetical protein